MDTPPTAPLPQGGSDGDDYVSDIVTGDDNAHILAGHTDGLWSDFKAGGEDFAALKLDENGTELWRWQVTPPTYLY